tara:strand:+ start:14234 stop:15019 length:786 start_codon:yes stop_codon:yes gene_type:complete
MLERLRLLPTVMLVAAMLLGLKVVHMVGGLSDVSVIDRAEAQAPAAKEPEEASSPEHGAEPAEDSEGAHGEAKAETEGGHAPKAKRGGENAMTNEEKQQALEAQTAKLNEGAQMNQAEMAVLGSLAARREEIEQRAKDFDLREQLLAAAEKRVEERIAELKALEAKINSQIAATDEQNEERLKSVVQMYETMKPKDAARIFERLDMGVLLDVSKRMNPRKMSAVLAVMDPVAAQDLTVELATGDRLPEVPGEAPILAKPAT